MTTLQTSIATGNVQKLKIQAFPDNDPNASGPAENAPTFQAMFNPREFALNYDIAAVTQKNSGISQESNQSGNQGQSTNTGEMPQGQGATQQVNSGDDTFSINLTVDGTGAHEAGKVVPVQDKVKQLFAVAFKGNVARRLKVCWGSALDVVCKLGKIGVTYKLFDRSGNPLRAELALTFYVDGKLEQPSQNDAQADAARKEDAKNDGTSSQTLKDGESLQQLTADAYGSPEMYLEVASFNGLDDFRNLEPGTTLVFPPLAVLSQMVVTVSQG